MKDLSLQELDTILCSTGYLPPRTEDELLFFTRMYEEYDSRLKNKHVDIDAIINGSCRIVSGHIYESDWENITHLMVADKLDCTYSMAARNYTNLSKEVPDKTKNNTNLKKDGKD